MRDHASTDQRNDTQLIEIIGRNRLINELLEAGLEVARPERDRGIDLIAYLDTDAQLGFVGRPIQMKAATEQRFSIHQKYERFPDLIFAFLWHLGSPPNHAETYALDYKEAFKVAEGMGWTTTSSWLTGGEYTTQKPSDKLRDLLRPHLMDRKKWNAKIRRHADGGGIP